MYKNKSYKPQLRIGLSRNDKSRTKSPIRITPTPGVKSRSLGISKTYKTSKHIDNLVKSPILINAITNSLPDDIKNSTRKTRNNEAKILRISEEKREDINNKEGVNIIPSLCEQTITYSPTEIQSSNYYRIERNMEPVEENETLHNTHKNMESEDTSISYSPQEILESTLNKKLDAKRSLKVERLIIGGRQNATKTPESKISNTSSLKMRKCSRLSLKKVSTTELSGDSNDDIKPFKKKAKWTRFQSNTSYDSNMSDCSVILDRLSEEIPKTNNEKNVGENHKEFSKREDSVVEFIDLNIRNGDKIDKKSLCNDIICLEQQLKSKINRLDSLKRSIIYKNKHNVQNLTAVSDIWKNGCKLALQDLLSKSQDVSQLNMTMSGLLMQLNIPENIFKCDPETDELI